jgi:hypothetical protein
MPLRRLPVAPVCNKVPEKEKTSGNRYKVKQSLVVAKAGDVPCLNRRCGQRSNKTQTVQAVGKSRGLFPRGAGQHLRFGFLF